jgi:hypothetical protein
MALLHFLSTFNATKCAEWRQFNNRDIPEFVFTSLSTIEKKKFVFVILTKFYKFVILPNRKCCLEMFSALPYKGLEEKFLFI